MRKITLITIIAVFAIFTYSIAQPFGGRGNGKMGSMGKLPGFNFYDANRDELKLTDAQIQKMEDIDNSFNKDRIDMQAKIQHSLLEFRNATDKKSINKDELFKKQEDFHKLQSEMQKKALNYKIELNDVLTDEQKSKIDDIRRNCQNKGMGFNGKGNRDGSGRGQCPGRGFNNGNCLRNY